MAIGRGSRSIVSRRLMSLRWPARIRACAGSCVARIAIAIRGRAFPDVAGSDIENEFLSRVCIRTFQIASLGIGRTDVIWIGVANRIGTQRKRRTCLRCRRSSRVSRQWPGYGLSRRWCPLRSAVSCCNRPFGTQNCRGHTHTREIDRIAGHDHLVHRCRFLWNVYRLDSARHDRGVAAIISATESCGSRPTASA